MCTTTLAHDILDLCHAKGHTIADLRGALCVGSPHVAVDDRAFLLVLLLSRGTLAPGSASLVETCRADDLVDAMIHHVLNSDELAVVLNNLLRVPQLDRKTATILSQMMTHVFPLKHVLRAATRGMDDGDVDLAVSRVLSRVGMSQKARQRAAHVYVQTVRSHALTRAATARGGST